MKSWFKDRHFRLLLKNSSYLAMSQVAAGAAGIVTVACAGRALGVALFGMLVLIGSYAQLVSGISKFQSWQLVVRYGSKVLESFETRDFREATSFAMGLDVLSGLVGMAIAIALLPLVGEKFGILHRYVGAAMVYCTLLPTMAAATPNGVLRTLQRFDLISWQNIASPIGRALLAAIAWAEHASFLTFLLIWYVTSLGGDLLLWFLAWRELKRRSLLQGIRPRLRPRALPGAWRFAIHVNLNTTLIAMSGPLANLIVGAVIGPSGAALFRAASTLSGAVRKPTDLLLKAFYPQIVGMDFASRTPWKFMVRVTATATLAALLAVAVLVVGGRPIIAAIFGHRFAGAYEPLLVLVISPMLSMVSFPLAPMLYSLNRPEAPVQARLAGTLVYLAVVLPLTWSYGLVGAAAGFVTGNAVAVMLMALFLLREYRRVRGGDLQRHIPE